MLPPLQRYFHKKKRILTAHNMGMRAILTRKTMANRVEMMITYAMTIIFNNYSLFPVAVFEVHLVLIYGRVIQVILLRDSLALMSHLGQKIFLQL